MKEVKTRKRDFGAWGDRQDEARAAKIGESVKTRKQPKCIPCRMNKHIDCERKRTKDGRQCRCPSCFAEEIKYPNSAEGAIQCLKESSTIKIEGPTARPDPSVQGVWEVKTSDGMRVIVYLRGYPDPFGYIRPRNDFEVTD